MIVNLIGWLCIGFFVIDFVWAIVEHRYKNSEKAYKLECLSLAALAIAAICFK